MLHVNSRNGAIPDHVMRAMFAARKSVFVDLLKWDVPVIAGRYEVDQFDNEHASYLVLATYDGAHLGSARLLPTTRPHILDSLYPDLCENAVPTGETTFEITRFCLDRGLRAVERRAVRNALISALADHALANGVTHYTAIAEQGWFQQVLAFGWKCRPLGVPQNIDGATLAAFSITIDANTPALLAAAGIRRDDTIAGNHQLAAA